MEPSNCKDWHAYPDRESVPAGETIRFHVSSWVPYRFGVGWALDADPKLSKLLRNVLHHLAGVTARTPYDPGSGSILKNKSKGL
jgi:hypothetical protein